MTLPSTLRFGQVRWRAVEAVADTAGDPDRYPDAVPISGRVTFVPSAPILLSAAEPSVTVFSRALTFDINDGVLQDKQGNDTVTLLANDAPDINPQGWTWTATYQLNNGLVRGSFAFDLPTDAIVDLTKVAPVGQSNGVLITRGEQGPPGVAGSEYPIVIHGSDPAVPRPRISVPVVWIGSVRPNQIGNKDVYLYAETAQEG